MSAQESSYRHSSAPAWGILMLTFLAVAAFLAFLWPDLALMPGVSKKVGNQATAIAPLPTLDAATLDRLRQQAEQTSAEQQALRNAIPTADTSKPPVDPTVAAASSAGGVATMVPARSFSPSDLGNRPAPTPTSMLPQEQFDASQASEEQNQLNTQLSGLTPAQQSVKVHDAEWSASNP